MDELFENNVKTMRIFIIVYVLIGIISLVIIWWPKDSNEIPDFAHYKEYTKEQSANKLANDYLSDIQLDLILGQTQSITDKVSEDYLKYNELDKESIRKRLKDNNLVNKNTKFGSVTLNTDGDNYIYSFDIINGNNRVRMNLIETFPYKYNITFDEHISYTTLGNNNVFDKMTINVRDVYRAFDYVEYTLEITNNGYSSIDFNLAAVTDAYLSYTGGTAITLDNPIKYDNEQLSNGSSIIKKVRFNLPINVQHQITSLTFTNVVIQGVTRTFTINV